VRVDIGVSMLLEDLQDGEHRAHHLDDTDRALRDRHDPIVRQVGSGPVLLSPFSPESCIRERDDCPVDCARDLQRDAASIREDHVEVVHPRRVALAVTQLPTPAERVGDNVGRCQLLGRRFSTCHWRETSRPSGRIARLAPSPARSFELQRAGARSRGRREFHPWVVGIGGVVVGGVILAVILGHG
jgi:hypothetical protein